MTQRKQIWTGISAMMVMLVLILDAKTAFLGAATSISLCYRTIIPSLFPFLVISILIGSNLTGTKLRILRPVGKICKIPPGAESLLLLGILGGYPVGAQAVYNAYNDRSISKLDARRLLGFCNNAGPAFIFGMMGSLFNSVFAPWLLWGIHILSAVIVGCILPGNKYHSCSLSSKSTVTVSQALEKGIKTISVICGWIIMFRIVIAFLQRWCLWLLSDILQISIIGALELSNGCCEMYDITCQGTRFILCSGFLAFGGICIFMQTRSVTADLGWGMYFPGKALQTAISVLMAAFAQSFLFSQAEQCDVSIYVYGILVLIAVGIVSTILLRKKVVAFSSGLVYNNKKYSHC